MLGDHIGCHRTLANRAALELVGVGADTVPVQFTNGFLLEDLGTPFERPIRVRWHQRTRLCHIDWLISRFAFGCGSQHLGVLSRVMLNWSALGGSMLGRRGLLKIQCR